MSDFPIRLIDSPQSIIHQHSAIVPQPFDISGAAMWLIDTETLELRQVVDSRSRAGSHRYAILSHTWGNDEVLFQDMADTQRAGKKGGWGKIEATCRIAKRKFKRAWVDTCCIDKTSSAELSEAINSMFAWYRDSTVCYVYLEDLDPLPPRQTLAEQRAHLNKHLPKCRWFSRGWTLQELIAPRVVEFFDKEWNFIGTKSELEDILSNITNVDMAILRDSSALFSIPIARRMSWAANRRTTRVEDRAYCLLGLFGINMPLLYGEGSNAFIRLQEHLVNQVHDLSLFAWQIDAKENTSDKPPTFGGIFAESPKYFKHCAGLKQHRDGFQLKNEFTITNNGLKMDASVRKLRTGWLSGSSDVSEADYLLSLDCVETSDRTENVPKWLAICFTKVGNTFVRLRPDKVFVSSSRSDWASQSVRFTMYISRCLSAIESQRIEAYIGAKICLNISDGVAGLISQLEAFPSDVSTLSSSKVGGRIDNVVFDCHGRDNFLGVFRFRADHHWFVLLCGIQWNGEACEPWITVHGTLGNSTTVASPVLLDAAYPRGARDPPDLDKVKDIMLCNHSNSAGLYETGKLPTSAYLREYVQFEDQLQRWETVNCQRVRGEDTVDGLAEGAPRDEKEPAHLDNKNVIVYRLN